jgi:hypothetical protein
VSAQGSTRSPARDRHDGADRVATGTGPARQRRATETKASFKTTELIVYIASVVAVLIAAAVVDQSDAGGLGARQAWLFVTILTVGYMISRGLAKSGSREPYWEDDDRAGR